MMERYLGSIWSAAPSTKPDSKRLRRKLQKVGNQQRSYSASSNEVKTVAPLNTNSKPAVPLARHMTDDSTTSKRKKYNSLPLPSSHGHDKWLEEFRESGYLYRDTRPAQEKPSPNMSTTTLVPEFAHLAVQDSPQLSPFQERAVDFPPTRPSRNPNRISRRYAKTPVSHIGQLEDKPPQVIRHRETLKPIPSIERLAESYRALLESRNSFMSDSTVDQFFAPEPSHDFDYIRDAIIYPPALESVAEEVHQLPLTRGSPRSDEATLVSFDDRSYFKRDPSVSSQSSYETASPGMSRREQQMPVPVAPPSRDNPSLQICFDLLTQELSSAVTNSSNLVNDKRSALQIWVMIEAYEKLRDQIIHAPNADGQRSPLAATLDVWIKSLHAVHDRMTGGDGERSESNYGD